MALSENAKKLYDEVKNRTNASNSYSLSGSPSGSVKNNYSPAVSKLRQEINATIEQSNPNYLSKLEEQRAQQQQRSDEIHRAYTEYLSALQHNPQLLQPQQPTYGTNNNVIKGVAGIGENFVSGVIGAIRDTANWGRRTAFESAEDFRVADKTTAEQAYYDALYGANKPADTRTAAQRELDEFMGISTPEYLAAKASDEQAKANQALIEKDIAQRGVPVATNWGRKYEETVANRYSDMTEGWQRTQRIGATVGQQIPAQIVRFIPYVGPFLSSGVFMASADQGAYEQALSEGATHEGAQKYGALIGAIESATELLGEGFAKVLKIAKVSNVPFTELYNTALTRTVKSNLLNNLFGLLAEMNSEGIEEAVADLVEPFAKAVYNEKTGLENWRDDVTLQTLWEDYLGGAIAGGLMAGVGGAAFGTFRAQNEARASAAVQQANERVREAKTALSDARTDYGKKSEQAKTARGALKEARQTAAQTYSDVTNYAYARGNRLDSFNLTKKGEWKRLSDEEAKRRYGDAESIKELIAESEALNPGNSLAERLSGKLEAKKDISGKEIRTLLRQNDTDIRNLEVYGGASENVGISETENTTPEAAAETPANGSPVMQTAAAPMSVAEFANSEERGAQAMQNAITRANAQMEQTASAAAETAEKTSSAVTEKSSAVPATVSKTERVAPAEEKNEAPVTLSSASKKYGAQAQAFVHTYQEGQDVAKFDRAYSTAREYGIANVPLSVVKGLKSVSYITEAQIENAYAAGRDAAKVSIAEQNSKNGVNGSKVTVKRPGTVRFDGGNMDDLRKTFNDKQGVAYRILSRIAEATGVNIVLYRSRANANGKFTNAEGRFSWDNDTIYIDVNAGLTDISDVGKMEKYTMLRTFSHEFTHFLQKWNPEMYDTFRGIVFEEMNKRLAERTKGSETPLTVEDLINKKLDDYRKQINPNFTIEQASNEVLADAMTDILPDSRFMERLYNENRTLAEKLVEQLKKFLADIKRYFSGLSPNTKTEANILKENINGTIKYVQSIVDAFDKLAAGAVENYQASIANKENSDIKEYGGKTQYEIREGNSQSKYEEYIIINKQLAEVSVKQDELEDSAEYNAIFNRITSASTDEEKTAAIEELAQWQNESGYGDVVKRGKELAAEARRLYQEYSDARNNELVTEQQEKIRKRGVSEEEFFRSEAVKEFGYTPYFYDAGYILPNGKMLNFSGEKGKHYGSRGQDHRAIGTIFAEEMSGSEAMVRFMHQGNIRIMAETPGVDIASKSEPSASQYNTISKFISAKAKEEYFSVDFTDERGYTVGNLEYEGRVNPSRVINDIKRYFQTGETNQSTVAAFHNQYSLRPVDPVEPSSGEWSRTKTTEEAMAAFPNMWNIAADESEKRNPTQITSTVGTYRKIFDILKSEGFSGTILDASSGLGVGTEAGRNEYGFNVDDIEPYPDSDYTPKYTDYSKLNKKYDVIISSAVLNVLPQDQRDALVVKMGRLLKDGGRMFITTRGKDVDNLGNTGKNIHLGNMEWIETVKGSYQKGFTNPELIAYLKDALGDGFTVVPASRETGGKFNNNTNVVVTKQSSSVQYAVREQDITITDDPMYPESQREQRAFNRSIANKTSDLKPGESNTIIVFTDSKAYYINADGYMSGKIVGVEELSYIDEDIEEEIDNGYREAEVSNPVLQSIRDGQRNRKRGNDTSENGRTSERDAGVDEEPYYRKPRRSLKERLADEGDGVSEPGQQYSLRDSEGNELSEAQREYFKDSKVRDANGSLLRMYHGTDANFTVFDPRLFGGKTGTAEGFGIYLTDNEAVAKSYGGKVLSGYANITHPARSDAKTISASTLTKLIRATCEAQALEMAANDDYDSSADAIRDTWVSNYTDTYGKSIDASYRDVAQQILRANDNDMDIVQEVMAGMAIRDYSSAYDFYDTLKEVTGIDGFITTWGNRETGGKSMVALAFDSNQFKNADNLSPTENEDIRYQLRESNLSNEDILVSAAEAVQNKDAKYDWLNDGERDALRIFAERAKTLREAQQKRLALLEEKRTLQENKDTRKRGELTRVQNNLDTVNGMIKRAEEELAKAENARVIKNVLKQARTIVEKDTRQRGIEELQAYKNRRNDTEGARKYRKQIADTAKTLSEWLQKNSDKEHVPEVLKQPLAELLSSIDFSSKRFLNGGDLTNADKKFRANLTALKSLIENQQKAISGEDGAVDNVGAYLDISEENREFLTKIGNDMASVDGTYTINRMTADDLKDFSKFLKNLATAIRKANKALANARYENIPAMAQSSIQHFEALGNAADAEGKPVSRFLKWTNATPYYAFRRFGEAGEALFDGLTKGWETLAYHADEIINNSKKTYRPEEAKKWREQVHSITLEDGSRIQMTTAQIMELSQLVKREQAMKHITKGGIRIGNFETKDGTKQNTTHYHLSAADLNNIIGLLSERQRKVADSLQSYMASRGREWGNEISMARFGYEFYDEGENYYPIRTDGSARPMQDTDQQNNSMFRLLNLSASKSLNPKASNALIVGDIFATYSDHMADMAKLNALGLPILDAIKWFNYTERTDNEDGTYDISALKKSMEKAFGTSAESYFRTLIKDINGTSESGDRGGNLAGKLMSNYKIAAVGANIRVALLQPTSIVRAMYVLKPKYILASFFSKGAYQEALKYSGTAMWKSLGYYDTDISKSMRGQIENTETVGDKIKDKTMILAEKGDQFTWGKLWTACKMQAKAQNRSLSGEELKQATAELFRKTIYATQVMDSTLTRSEMMRSRTKWNKIVTAFMAEPTLSYNLMMDAEMQYSMDKKKYGKAKAWQRNKGNISLAAITYVASAALAAFAESVWDAFRDDDDYETFMQKFLQAFLGEGKIYDGNFAQDLTVIGKIPVIKDILATMRGQKSSDISVASVESITNAFNIWKETIQISTGKLEKPTDVTYYGKMTPWGKIYKSLQALSQLTGFAVSNMTRDVSAIWNTAVGGFAPDMKIRTYANTKANQIKYSYQDGYLSEEKTIEALIEAGEAKTEAEAKKTIFGWRDGGAYGAVYDALHNGGDVNAAVSEMTENGYERKDVLGKVKSKIKEFYIGTDEKAPIFTRDRASEELIRIGAAKNATEADKIIFEWDNGGSAYNGVYGALTGGGNVEAAIQEMTKHGYKRDDVIGQLKGKIGELYKGTDDETPSITEGQAKTYLTKYCGMTADDAAKRVGEWKAKRDTGYAPSEISEALADGDITRSEAESYWQKYGGKTAGEARVKADSVIYGERYPDWDTGSIEGYLKKYENIGAGVMDKDKFLDSCYDISKMKGEDANGDGKTDRGSLKNKVVAYIAGLNISTEAKDALYFVKDYAKSDLKNTPWH